MDPNACLDEIRRLYNAIADDECETLAGRNDIRWNAYRLAELVESLDQWIQRGGFLPAGWNTREVTR